DFTIWSIGANGIAHRHIPEDACMTPIMKHGCQLILSAEPLFAVGCAAEMAISESRAVDPESTSDVTPRVERVLTREEQDALTPDAVFGVLRNGNERFVAGTLTARDHSKLVRDAALGQFPKAVILS